MGGGISSTAKQELVATIRDRYQESSKKEKGRILDEFMAVTGHHRKYGIRLLAPTGYDARKSPVVQGRRIYDEAVREAVIVVWEAADRICGKRLKAALPNLAESMERCGHLSLGPAVRERSSLTHCSSDESELPRWWVGFLLLLSPNPPMDRDGRREDTGRGVRKLRKRWSGLEFG